MSTSPKSKDPLLVFSEGFLKLAMWAALISSAIMILAALLSFWHNQTYVGPTQLEWLSGIARQSVWVTRVPLVGAVLVAAMLMAGIWFFLRELAAIVASVAAGNPLSTANAERLHRMSIAVVCYELLANFGDLIAGFDDGYAGRPLPVETAIPNTGYVFEFSGLLLIITLFILARVFRIGAQMHADLEGTV